MSYEIQAFSSFPTDVLDKSRVVICPSENIRCRFLEQLRDLSTDRDVILAMPDWELGEGTSGRAKAEIAGTLDGINVASCTIDQLKGLAQESGESVRLGNVQGVVFQLETVPGESNLTETSDPIDREMIRKVHELIPDSTCWWRPTACIFTDGQTIVTEAVSTNQWRTNCLDLSIPKGEIKLNQGEAINFCDAVHSEKLAIAQATKIGLSLDGTTLYVTTCPCLECAQAVVETGVKRVVFDSDYYSQDGLLLLKKYGIEVFKIKNE